MAFYIWIYILLIILGIIIQRLPIIMIKGVKGKVYYKNTLLYLYIVSIVLVVIMGMRDISVGRDTQMYGRIFLILGRANLFENVSNSVSGYWGYRLLCKIIYMLGGNYQSFLLFTSAITVVGVTRFIKYTSENYFMSIILYYVSFFYLQAFNSARQALAISVCLNAYVELERKKYFRSIILCIIACLVHNTAIIMVVIYAIKFVRWNYRKLIIYFMGIVGGCLCINLFIKFFLFLFPRYAVIYTSYLAGNVSTVFGSAARGRKALVSIFYFFILLFTLFFTDRDKMETGFGDNWNLIALSVVEMVIGIIFRNNNMMLRIQLYFSIFLVSCIPNCIQRMKVGSWVKRICNVGICGIMTVPFFVQLLDNHGSIIPYSMFLK